MTSLAPQIAFTAHYEDDIKNRIFDAMDCSLFSNKRFGTEFRWFKDYPEFILTKSFPWDKKDWASRKVSDDFGKWFNISTNRINKLYTLIKGLFPNGTFTSYHKIEYPITIHQIFRLSDNLWANTDLQSVFYCKFKGLPEEYKEWSEMALSHDYTYMMSDSGSTNKAGRLAEERMVEAKKDLDNKVCILWYNFILGRMRTRPQDGSFGIHTKDEWNTLANAYIVFNINPETETYETIKVTDKVNTPCIGFPPHPKKVGWMEGDYNMDTMYSNARFLTKEEYEVEEK